MLIQPTAPTGPRETDLDAMPIGTVLIDEDGLAYQKHWTRESRQWVAAGVAHPFTSRQLLERGPLMLAYLPSDRLLRTAE